MLLGKLVSLRNLPVKDQLPYPWKVLQCTRVIVGHIDSSPERFLIHLQPLNLGVAEQHPAKAPVPYRQGFGPLSCRFVIPE